LVSGPGVMATGPMRLLAHSEEREVLPVDRDRAEGARSGALMKKPQARRAMRAAQAP